MSARDPVPARTDAQQARVSDPAVSAWVSANAGAGKTTVLVRRVIRLLLDGNPPARILCLTFTKAAAANMASKVLETLSKWVRLDDAALDAALRKVSPLPSSPELRARARRLFAQALETPGGLKVQTIHAFCDRVLHQFPFEAGVQAGFEVLDEVREADLLERARRSVLIDASNDPDGALGRALTHAVAAASDDSLDKALTEAVRERRKVRRLIENGGAAAVAAALGLQPGETVATVEDEIVARARIARSEWTNAAAVLAPLGGNAAKCGERLSNAAASDPDGALDAYLSVFFTQDGEPRDDGGFGNTKARALQPELIGHLIAERNRLLPLRDRRRAAQALERTAALLTLAAATIERFEAAKRARGALDYADLIDKTAAMFDDTAASWVLYKLDGGIDHVLIDEAQDTSPEQWSVIARLTEEFFAGEGARDAQSRTIFAVGDEKQSIFSFQGADPAEFGRMRSAFKLRVTGGDAEFEHVRLDLSFRSAPGVLQAVDQVFSRPEAYAGLTSGDGERTIHGAIRSRAPALVEIWPPEKPDADQDDEPAWSAPLDAKSEASPVTRLAQCIASAATFWLGGGLTIADRDTGELRNPRAGDVIVLVRRRGPLFEAVLQALKRANVPVAGADRLTLTDHIAVMDLMALGDALTLERDELALASVLKSPLFGLSEDDLFALAHERKGTLAASLIGNAQFKEAAEKFVRWRREASELRPFDFYSRVLARDRGREQMLARLGMEAADALDEFLARALAYEQTETPSLTGFLSFLRRAGTEVKRDLEVESSAVRVMTVHGAKGLEAPVIVLADTMAMPDGRHDAKLLDLPNSDAFAWALGSKLDSARLGEAREAAARTRAAEYRRLLYVALTRAADALIVCGHESARQKSGPPEGCWYQLVNEALKDELVAGPAPGFAGTVGRWRPQEAGAAAPRLEKAHEAVELPPWLGRTAPAAAAVPRRITPSRFDPDDAPLSPFAHAANGTLAPRRRGDLVHRLLQYLPDVATGERKNAAARFLVTAANDLNEAMREALAAEAIAIVEHPELADLFRPTSRAEVDLLAHMILPEASEISGRVDRLSVTPDTVWIADFKTGRRPPDGQDAPGNYIRQLAVYRDVLARIYPGRAMRALLIWTEHAAIQEIPADWLDAAMAAVSGKVTPP